jgi:hypothetical protein
MNKKDMISKLVETFENSDEDTLMLLAEANANEDGSFSVRVTEGKDNELFTIHGEIDQDVDELRNIFTNLMSEAIKEFIEEEVEF